jgi:hypothetical protein
VEDGVAEVKIGALCWNQYTDWPNLLEAGVRADRLGYDTLWTWDTVTFVVATPAAGWSPCGGLSDPFEDQHLASLLVQSGARLSEVRVTRDTH